MTFNAADLAVTLVLALATSAQAWAPADSVVSAFAVVTLASLLSALMFGGFFLAGRAYMLRERIAGAIQTLRALALARQAAWLRSDQAAHNDGSAPGGPRLEVQNGESLQPCY